MARYLCISATLLTGRYHGRQWPPSPARLLKALVNGVMTGGYRRHWAVAELALRWLEGQPPPTIVAAPAHAGSAYRLAAPNNDLDVAAREWAKGKPYDAARLKTMKTVAPRMLAGAEPHLHYLWPVEGEAPLGHLRTLARCLHTLGWGVDMAYADARLVDEAAARRLAGERYVPSQEGDSMEVPIPGFLDDVLETHRRFCRRQQGKGVDPDTRPSVYGIEAYRRLSDPARPWAAFALRTRDGSSVFAVDYRRLMVVAAWMRHASAEALRQEGAPREWVDSYILGHHPPGAGGAPRLSILPLPSIGHPHSDGRVRRVALAAPAGGTAEPVRLLELKLRSSLILDENQHPACRLGRIENPQMVLPFYFRRARLWQSVTPVILHGFNTQRGKLSLAKTERLLMQAFEEAGLPAGMIVSLAFQTAPYWPGAGAALQIRVPAHLAGWPRLHVAVEFRPPIPGPVAAGIGRHYGLGLFAARE